MLRSILIAGIMCIAVLFGKISAVDKADPPSSFDLRNVDGTSYVTSIKSQQGGTCWTHGTMAAIESNLLMTGGWTLAGEEGEPNLAEYHLDWWNGFNQYNNDDTDPPTGGGLTVHEGGDYLVAAAYINRGEGAVRDIDGQSFDFPPERFNSSYHHYYVREIEWYQVAEDLSNIKDVKTRIMTGGAIGTCMGAFYYSSAHNSYYQPPEDPTEPSHAIAIIGWDDNKITQAPDPGAWLCKNSWGDDQYGGCFWISYYDKSCGKNPEMGAVAFLDAEPLAYDEIYYHDYHGWRDVKEDCSEAFNAFTARQYHEIQAVSFYTAIDNIAYTVKIYDRFEGGELLDELVMQSGTIERRGFHTIDIDNPVVINSGDDFYVYLQLSDGGHPYDRTSVVPVLLGANYRTEVISAAWPGESYYREGGQWLDLYDLDTTANFCIKALAVTPSSLEINFPDGLPLFVEPDQPTTFNVQIVETGDTYIAGSAALRYRNHDSTYVTASLVSLGGDLFLATLPPAGIGSIIRFYFTAEAVNAGLICEPDCAPEDCYTAVAGDFVDVFSDNFETDLGWWVYNGPYLTDGAWERGVPVGGGVRGDPPTDYDGSGSCYLTGNAYGDSDVDDGITYLTSPVLDLSVGDGLISYARWYSNNFGSAPFSDIMRIQISNDNGYSWATVDMAGPEKDASGGWSEQAFRAGNYVIPNNQVKLRFSASDLADSSIVEAAIDAFSVTSYDCTPEPLTIVTTSLPDWTAGHPYSQYLVGSGGVGMYRWLDTYVDLEGTGLTLSLYGSLSGTPLIPGPISFTALLADENDNTALQVLSFTINEAISITTASLPDWTFGIPYSIQMEATGGTGDKAWIDKDSDLVETGLTLTSTGYLSGIPDTIGSIGFTAFVTDDVGAVCEQIYSLIINPAVSITTETLPTCVVGEAYCCSLKCAGGTGEMTWTDHNNDLTGTGLVLAPNGEITGTVDIDTAIAFTARVADAVGSFEEKLLTIDVMSSYICGDANDDGDVNVGDAVFIIGYVFNGGPAPDPLCAGDTNGDGSVNVGDAVYLIGFIFKDGVPPVEPCCP